MRREDLFPTLAVLAIVLSFLFVIFSRLPSLSETSINIDDSDFYLIRLAQVSDLLSSTNPYTGSGSEIYFGHNFRETFQLLASAIGLSLIQSYVLFQSASLVILLIFASKVLKTLKLNSQLAYLWIIVWLISDGGEVILRPTSPLFHFSMLVLWLHGYLVLQYASLSTTRFLFHLMVCFIVGFGYPFFALFACLFSITFLIYSKDVFNKFAWVRFWRVNGVLYLGFAVNLVLNLSQSSHSDMLGTTHLRFPAGVSLYPILFTSIMVGHILVRRTHSKGLLFTNCGLLAISVILVSPIVTSRELEFSSHYKKLIFLFVVLLLLILIQELFDSLSIRYSFNVSILSIWKLLFWASLVYLSIILHHPHNFAARAFADDGKKLIPLLISAENSPIGKVTIVAPEEIVPQVVIETEHRVLWSNQSLLYPQSIKEQLTRSLLSRMLLGEEQLNPDPFDRGLFNTKYINSCNRVKIATRVIGYYKGKVKSSCEVSFSDMVAFYESLSDVQANTLRLMKTYDVGFIIRKVPLTQAEIRKLKLRPIYIDLKRLYLYASQ